MVVHQRKRLAKAGLMVNARGRVVSKKAHDAGRKAYGLVQLWTTAVSAARKKLKIVGFCPVGGQTTLGQELHRCATAIYTQLKSASVAARASPPSPPSFGSSPPSSQMSSASTPSPCKSPRDSEELVRTLQCQLEKAECTVRELQERCRQLEERLSNAPHGSPPGFEAAGKLIQKADVMVLLTGAGFSADSGLLTYSDIAKVPAYSRANVSYADLCDPSLLHRDPALFWGFWGQCLNDYRNTAPHAGHAIINQWAQQQKLALKAQERHHRPDPRYETPVDGHAGAFFVFTSNVDAHHYDWCLAEEIMEVHGNIEYLQCADPKRCGRNEMHVKCPEVSMEQTLRWRVPKDWCFEVDPATRRAQRVCRTSEEVDGSKAVSSSSSPSGGCVRGGPRLRALRYMPYVSKDKACAAEFGLATNLLPQCNRCKGPARPSIVMFEDQHCVENVLQEQRWLDWVAAVKEVAQEQPLRIAIVEIGAGTVVRTVREQSESLLAEFGREARTALVRINPDCWRTEVFILPSTGLDAVQRMSGREAK